MSLALACNLEVGNPDTGDAPAPGLSSVSMRLTQFESCSIQQPCNSVPVEAGLPHVDLRYELTGAVFSLETLTPEPFADQIIGSEVELIREKIIMLPQSVSEQQVTGLKLNFSPKKGSISSWRLTGVLVGSIAGEPVRVALPLSGGGDIVGSVVMPATGLEAVELDPAVWFEFAGEKDLAGILKHLQSGACHDMPSPRCSPLKGMLSGMIERRIAQSLRAQGKSAQLPKSEK